MIETGIYCFIICQKCKNLFKDKLIGYGSCTEGIKEPDAPFIRYDNTLIDNKLSGECWEICPKFKERIE